MTHVDTITIARVAEKERRILENVEEMRELVTAEGE
jgi:hypothetical protein